MGHVNGKNGKATDKVVKKPMKVTEQQMGRFCVQKLVCILLQKMRS
jgi:hypothetical protein